ncbi:MAG TPA: hypothetical protein VM166_08750 [Gemmatimonadaceae bacterium]|nr:hypothetical protein [Gemmatimonadaceae bacterium]
MAHNDAPVPPSSAFEAITAPENTTQAVAAMQSFLLAGDEAAFEYAVAVYVASARHRNEPIEIVTGALCVLAGEMEGPRQENDLIMRPTRMHQLLFNGILRAFYGDVAVDRAIGATAQRKADAPQHSKSGTWPRRPAE